MQLVLPAGRGVRRRTVPAELAPMDSALRRFLDTDPAGLSESAGAWAAVVVAGLNLVARGRIMPAVTPSGLDAWRVGPLDVADEALIAELAAALPPVAHCLPRSARTPIEVASPEHLVRALWDALADVLVRTAAAPVAAGADLFAAREAQQARQLGGWLAEASRGIGGGIAVGLRIELDRFGDAAGSDEWGSAEPEPDVGEDEVALAEGQDAVAESAGTPVAPARAVVQVTSSLDPSLVVDAADLFEFGPAVLARLGPKAEEELLLALRRGGRAWPALSPVLNQKIPSHLDLDDAAIDDLLGEGAQALAAAGIDVLWPAGLLAAGLTVTASITSAPEPVVEAGFSLNSILTFRWQAALGGEPLTPEEMDQLAEAKRGLVRIRGRWVAVDPALIAKLRDRRERRMPAAEALAAAMAGEMVVDSETVPVVAEGTLAAFAEKLRSLGDGSAEPIGLPPGLAGELRHYQERGVSWLYEICELALGGCLADDMGLGKTIQVIALHLHRVAAHRHKTESTLAPPTLVVCPASLLGNWAREVARFAPDTPVRRYHGSGRSLEDLAAGELVVTTYGVARRDRADLARAAFSLVVADEAQHAKNPMSDTARALRELGGEVRIALTGTPVENRLTELWSILDWTTPGLLGPLERFRRTVALPIEQRRDPEVTERLSRSVRPFLLRRKKTDPRIAPDLPERIVTDHAVSLTAEQATLYEAEVREALAAIREKKGIQRQGLVFRMLTVLKQICNHPAQYLHQPGPIVGRSGKLAALEELLDVIIAEGESVLVFSQYVEMCSLLEARLSDLGVDTLFLHGGVGVRARDRLVAGFQAGQAPVFLLSLKAGGVGLNLTRASHVVHYDRWWNPAVEDQATDRTHRIGQEKTVQVHRLVAEGTLEDRIVELLEKKRALAEAVVGEGEASISKLSDEELADLVTLASTEAASTKAMSTGRARSSR